MTPDEQMPADLLLAGELALGVLTGEERIIALERMLADPDFAAEVAWWREQLGELLNDYASVTAPPLKRDLAVDRELAAIPRHRRWLWLSGGALGGAAAASLALVALLPLRDSASVPKERPAVVQAVPRETAIALLAVLTPSKGEQGEAVAVFVDRATITIRLSATITVPEGRVAELWRIGADKVPRAIVLLPAKRRTAKPANVDELPLAAETIAISVEPLGGSPTGKPTGPVIASGQLVTT